LSRVLLEKLTGSQLVKKFPTFYGTMKVHYHVYKCQLPIPVLSPNIIQVIKIAEIYGENRNTQWVLVGKPAGPL
jgi:hypothetical protein